MEMLVTIKKSNEVIGNKIITSDSDIGRLTENSISLMDVSVSRKHAKIIFKEDNIYIRDLNSANGTFLNGRKLEPMEEAPLRKGDEIKIAFFSIVVDMIKNGSEHVSEDVKEEKTEEKFTEIKLEEKSKKNEKKKDKSFPVIKFNDFRRNDIELKDIENFIGKDDSCVIQLSGLFIPKVCGVIKRESDNTYSLTSLGGLLKLKVNDRKLNPNETVTLKHRDVVKIGNYEFEFYHKQK